MTFKMSMSSYLTVKVIRGDIQLQSRVDMIYITFRLLNIIIHFVSEIEINRLNPRTQFKNFLFTQGRSYPTGDLVDIRKKCY